MSETPIIVGGCHRSGTSLVRRLLDAHSRIHCPPELKFMIDFYGDYRDDRHAHARFFRTARDLVGDQQAFRLFGSAFVEMHANAAAAAGKARWADKNPENVLYLGEWRALLGDDWVLIHVIRDPRDVVSSMQEAGFPYADVASPLEARLEHYLQCAEQGLAFGREFPERYHAVHYEELVCDPEATLAPLMAALGEDFEQRQLRLSAGGSPAGLEDPKAAERDGIDASGVGRWRTDLDAVSAEHIQLELRARCGTAL
jgi:hypothetical protein